MKTSDLDKNVWSCYIGGSHSFQLTRNPITSKAIKDWNRTQINNPNILNS